MISGKNQAIGWFTDISKCARRTGDIFAIFDVRIGNAMATECSRCHVLRGWHCKRIIWVFDWL